MMPMVTDIFCVSCEGGGQGASMILSHFVVPKNELDSEG